MEGSAIVVRAPVARGANVRRAAEDVTAGDVLLHCGDCVGPGEIGVLASQRFAHVVVHRRPRVAILSTGDELRDVSDPPEPGTIVDSNSHALAAQVRDAGAEAVVLPRAPDAPEAIAGRIREGLAADALLSCGGVSVGAYDHVHEAFTRAGVELGFWKVAIKPGKPLAFGRAGKVPVVGLPGNPVSAMVTFEILVRPGLRRMLGDPRPHPVPVRVRLERPLRHKRGRTELVRARLAPDAGGGPPIAHPHPRQGSASLPSMAGIDAFVVLPAAREEVRAEDGAWALPFGAGAGQATSPFAAGGVLADRPSPC